MIVRGTPIFCPVCGEALDKKNSLQEIIENNTKFAYDWYCEECDNSGILGFD